jgi:flagellar biosynthetic protein FliO
MLLGLGGVWVLLVGSLWLLKRLTAVRGPASGMMRVVAATAVGGRERVVIVEVGSTWLVLGVAPGAFRRWPKSLARRRRAAIRLASTAATGWLQRLMKATLSCRDAEMIRCPCSPSCCRAGIGPGAAGAHQHPAAAAAPVVAVDPDPAAADQPDLPAGPGADDDQLHAHHHRVFLLRHALGTQTSPPNQVLVGLALFLTFFIMAPVGDGSTPTPTCRCPKTASAFNEALERGAVPLRLHAEAGARRRPRHLHQSRKQPPPVTRPTTSRCGS